MSDTPTIQERLRDSSHALRLTREAASYIDELEKACVEWAEVSQSNYQRAKAAEANLAKAVNVGNKMAKSIEGNYYLPSVAKEWRTTLAEPKGETYE